MRPLTDRMCEVVDRLRATPGGAELSGRDLRTAEALGHRQLATRVRRLTRYVTLNGYLQRREVWRLTERGRALAGSTLSHAPSVRTSRAPSARRSPRRDGQAGRGAC